MNNHDQEFLVQKIRTQYTEKQHTELDERKTLDATVKKPANVFGYTFGSCLSGIQQCAEKGKSAHRPGDLAAE